MKKKDKVINLKKKSISYNSTNPLKSLLKNSNKSTIKVSGGDKINLMKAEW